MSDCESIEKTFKDKDGKEYRKKVNVDNYKAHIDKSAIDEGKALLVVTTD